jgi:hypothetical protein
MEKQFLQQENKLGKKRIVDKIVVSPVNERSFSKFTKASNYADKFRASSNKKLD